MDKEILEKYKKAGKILKGGLDHGAKFIKPGNKIIKVVEEVEKKILNQGGGFAFPVNVSINQNAAHDTADVKDDRTFKERDLVKLDAGVQVDGYIADSARTISLNSGKEELIKASEKALGNALKMMKPGTKMSKVSKTIEDTIKKMGFNPIINLTGHGLDKYDLHARMEFPNVRTKNEYVLKEGDVFALEPFSTDGSGKVVESSKTLIYKYSGDKPVRIRESRKIIDLAKNKFHKLPFAKRWIVKEIPNLSKMKLNLILKQLVQNGSLHDYPVLKEREDGNVAQKEHTVIVKDNPIITTK